MRTTWTWAAAVLMLSCSSSESNAPPSHAGQGGSAGSAGEAGAAGQAGAPAEQMTVPRLPECLAGCAALFPDGLAAFGNLTKSCACETCASACPGVCADAGGALDESCADNCFVAAVDMGSCDNQKYDCDHDAVCQKYFSCATLCITPVSITVKITLDQMRQACVDRINDYRAIEGVGPVLTRRENFEVCTDGSAVKDEQLNKPHASFGDCGETGQNECFQLGAQYGARMFLRCLEEMYMEKYTGIDSGGHYENMVRTSFTSLACGFGVQSATQNFY
jgi:hypothetical protein